MVNSKYLKTYNKFIVSLKFLLSAVAFASLDMVYVLIFKDITLITFLSLAYMGITLLIAFLFLIKMFLEDSQHS